MNYKKASDAQKSIQQKLDAALRRCDDFEAESEFIKRQLNDVDLLKDEISEAHKRNQNINEQLSQAKVWRFYFHCELLGDSATS